MCVYTWPHKISPKYLVVVSSWSDHNSVGWIIVCPARWTNDSNPGFTVLSSPKWKSRPWPKLFTSVNAPTCAINWSIRIDEEGDETLRTVRGFSQHLGPNLISQHKTITTWNAYDEDNHNEIETHAFLMKRPLPHLPGPWPRYPLLGLVFLSWTRLLANYLPKVGW